MIHPAVDCLTGVKFTIGQDVEQTAAQWHRESLTNLRAMLYFEMP